MPIDMAGGEHGRAQRGKEQQGAHQQRVVFRAQHAVEHPVQAGEATGKSQAASHAAQRAGQVEADQRDAGERGNAVSQRERQVFVV